MLNKAKCLEYFDATELIKKPVHIIGCGSIGSHLAELFARQGVEELHIWDMDTVSAHNITNQMFFQEDINTFKVDAVEAMMHRINPEMKIIKHPEGWLPNSIPLAGYVFLCVDDIELRKLILKINKYNPKILAYFDFRTRLHDAQHYAARTTDDRQMSALLASMDFTHEEAKSATPISACGYELNVVDVVKVITSIGFANFRNFLKTGELKTFAVIDMESLLVDVM